MELHKIISGLNILGREQDQTILLEKIRALHQGQGGVVLLKGKSEYGQKAIVRDIIANAGIYHYYGCGTHISTPYDLLQYSFSKLLNGFRDNFDQSLQSVNKLKKSIYKGIVGKATRKFARSSSSIEEKEPTDLNFAVCRDLLARETPAIFYCEELQWADSSSLDALLFAIKSILSVGTPILFIVHVDLENQGSIKPFSLRKQKVSVLEELKAMNLEIKRRTGTRPKDFIAKIEEMEFAEIITFQRLEDKVIEKLLRKFFGHKLFSENFIYKICQLAEGSGFFLGEILLYLSHHILEFRGQKWQLKYPEHEIQLPQHIDYFIHSNLQDLGENVFGELQRAALLYAPIVKNDWENSTSIARNDFETAMKKAIQFGVLRNWSENHLLFEHDLYRQVLIASCPEKESKLLQKNIATSLTEKHSAFLHLHHWKNSSSPEMSLDYIIKAGIENEKIMAYEVAYFLYEEGARIFPEAKDMFIEIEKDMLAKSKEKKREELLDPLFTLLKLYRIAGLIDKGMPIISIESIALWRKIIYDHEPSKTFAEFALLIIFLMKSHKASVKTYDKDEVETLADMLIRELIPGKDYQTKVFFLDNLAEFTKNKELSDRLAINLEKWGEAVNKEKDSNPILAVRKYFRSFEVYKTLQDYFNSARVLHTIIKFCQSHKNNYSLSLVQIEALRLLAESYRSWCYEQKRKDEEKNEVDSQKYIHQALQATASYIDCSRFDLEHKKCPWLSLHNLQKAYEFSEEFYVENNLIIELLQKASNEWENLEENQEHEKSALIIANNIDAGAASVIAEAVYKEKVLPQVDVVNIRDTETILEKMSQHNISFLLMQPSSKFSFYKEEDILPIIASYHKEQDSGWFIREHGEHTQFIIWEKTSAELFATCLRFLEENIFRSYV